jgi:hypothetical protein
VPNKPYLAVDVSESMPYACMGDNRNAYRILVKDNIEMDLREDGVVCTGLIWLRIEIGGGLL